MPSAVRADTPVTVELHDISQPEPSCSWTSVHAPIGALLANISGYINSNGNGYINVNSLRSILGVGVATSYLNGQYVHTITRMGQTTVCYSGSSYLYTTQDVFGFAASGQLGDYVRNVYDVPLRVATNCVGVDYIDSYSSNGTTILRVWDTQCSHSSLSTSDLIAGPWLDSYASMNPLLAGTSFHLKDFACRDEDLISGDHYCGGIVKLERAALLALQATLNKWVQQGHTQGFRLSVESNASRGRRCWEESCVAAGRGAPTQWPLCSHLTGKAIDFSPKDGNILALQTMVANDINGNQSLGWRWYEAYSGTPTWVHAQTILYPAR
jgi:hypothetical protein